MSSMPSAKVAALNSGRGSRPGFSSSFRMSRTVGRPKRVVGELLGLERAQEGRVADHLLHLLAASSEDALDHRIGFRMHRRGIQRLLAIGDAQEAGALLEGLVAQARHLQQRLARGERAVLRRGYARCSRPPWRTGRRRAPASALEAVFTSTPTAFTQSSTLRPARAPAVLVDVVLVLADADRLGLDLDQFRQRVLQAARDRHRAAQRHIEARGIPSPRVPRPNTPRRRPR
jgi:hypothetical protein